MTCLWRSSRTWPGAWGFGQGDSEPTVFTCCTPGPQCQEGRYGGIGDCRTNPNLGVRHQPAEVLAKSKTLACGAPVFAHTRRNSENPP